MKKLVGLIIAMLLILSICACGVQPTAEKEAESGFASGSEKKKSAPEQINEDKEGLVIHYNGNEKTVAWNEIGKGLFEGDSINGKGESFHGKYEGEELRTLLAANGIKVLEDSVVSVISEDDYSAEFSGAEILDKGKVYIALSLNDEMIEGSKGGQGAQLIVFGDPNRKRSVKYLRTVTVD